MKDIWENLQAHHDSVSDRSIASLFDTPGRFEAFTAETDGLLLDYSKTNLDDRALTLLVELAQATNVTSKRDAMFAGVHINETEDRAVLHTALRAPADAGLTGEAEEVRADYAETLTRMKVFSDAIRSGHIKSGADKVFTDVINIGIGGSDLGPAMAVLALAPYHDGPRAHFVSNVDGADIHDTLRQCDPETTLIIVASKTFTTIETMTNAETAVTWLKSVLGEAYSDNLAAVSSAPERTAQFGIDPVRVFGFADSIGGRYSLWGPVGLPILMAVGSDDFDALLAGAYAMDRHFCTAPLSENLPVLMGLIGIWHNNICGCSTRAVLPYDNRLARLPAYLQQLDMESNGKGVTTGGLGVPRNTGPVVWGEPGTNGQHAFYQMIHQGTSVIPTEFLIAAEGHEPDLAHQHRLLIANCLAQSEALMHGRSIDEARKIAQDEGHIGEKLDQIAAHKTFPGNRPSLTIAYPKLTPFVLGQIIALYEHRVFTEAAIWGINAFDQWGVELGKVLAKGLQPFVDGTEPTDAESSTHGLIRFMRS